MAMGGIGPRGRGDGDEMVTEVDKGSNVLPVIEVVVLDCPVETTKERITGFLSALGSPVTMQLSSEDQHSLAKENVYSSTDEQTSSHVNISVNTFAVQIYFSLSPVRNR